jgi:anhydro-N-acetylmuramic acid kinase
MIRIADGKTLARQQVRAVGLMSGTSCDGIDAALVDVTDSGVKLLAFDCRPYTREMREALLRLCSPETCRVDDLCHLNFALGELLAAAVFKVALLGQVEPASIDVVGSHGHTVWHIPRGRRFGRRTIRSTLQIGEPCVIAERTGILTVADFRPRDIAAGGQGAPLVPYVDYRLFSDERIARAMLNIGGIANVTYLRRAGRPEDIVAFDTGPGNMILDRLAEIVTGGRLRCDLDGAIAAAGTVDTGLLATYMRLDYFKRKPPKSTGRESFGRDFAGRFLDAARARKLSDAGLMATAAALTAQSVADAFRRHLPGPVDEVIVSGGGALNPTLMGMLAEHLAPARVLSSAEIGLDPSAKEALAFAVLAVETAQGRCNNAPAATGAKAAAVLGKIVPGRPGTDWTNP